MNLAPIHKRDVLGIEDVERSLAPHTHDEFALAIRPCPVCHPHAYPRLGASHRRTAVRIWSDQKIERTYR